MKVKTEELTGAALDWAVAKCESIRTAYHDDGITRCIMKLKKGCEHSYAGKFAPSTDWAQAGPLIERAGLAVETFKGCLSDWRAYEFTIGHVYAGPTPLIAAMRCYVAFKLGDEIEVPDTLAA